jgi:hypothetical protein
MSFTNEVSPSVTIKKKSLSALLECCIENKIDFTLKAKSNDDFDVEFILANTQKAIILGMCLKELKLELNGLTLVSAANLKANKKVLPAKETSLTVGPSVIGEADSELAFEDALKFDLGNSN